MQCIPYCFTNLFLTSFKLSMYRCTYKIIRYIHVHVYINAGVLIQYCDIHFLYLYSILSSFPSLKQSSMMMVWNSLNQVLRGHLSCPGYGYSLVITQPNLCECIHHLQLLTSKVKLL